MAMQRVAVVLLALVTLSASSPGCFTNGEDAGVVPPEDLAVSPSQLVGAQLQYVEFSASSPMNVHVPYLVLDQGTGLFTNVTILHFDSSGSQTIEMIAPPNIRSAFFLLGKGDEFAASESWPIRESNQSWEEWFESEDFQDSPYSWLEHPVLRENRSGFSADEGSLHGTGLIDGLSAFQWLEAFADPDSGYNERWGPFTLYDATYMRSVNYIEGYLSGMGWDAQIHRYWISDFNYAVNVCGYKTGTMYPDEWLVLGAHLDVAEPGSPPGGGTRIGAHDNGAGVALVLEAGRGLVEFDHRRTVVLCFWSNE